MPKNLLFTSLSLISGISKYQEKEEGSFKGMEIEKNSTFVISGTYSNVNNFWGISVQNTGTEDNGQSEKNTVQSENIENGGEDNKEDGSVEEDTKFYSKGAEISANQIREGDKLKVTYDGSVSLVYPPKLNAVSKVEIVEEKKIDE